MQPGEFAVPENGTAPHEWRKSSVCHQATCVEVRFIDDAVHVRQSRDPDGRFLEFTPSEWNAFLAGARRREFDLP
jgi:hypothetical protein